MPADKSFVPFVSLKPIGKNGIQLTHAYRVKYKKSEEGRLSCYIPSLDIYFGCKNKEAVRDKSRTLTNLYFDHFFVHSKDGVKKLILELHKLGFKSNDNYAYLIHKLSKREFIPAKFKSVGSQSPDEFLEASEITDEATMEVAV